VESGTTVPSPSRAHSPQDRGVPRVEISASKGVSSSAEQLFDTLLHDSVTEVFNGVLGMIAGPALIDAVKRDTSLEMRDLSRKPDLLDQALVAHLGSAAKVLERKILKTLATKTVTGFAPREASRLDFSLEVENVRKQFLKRKQAANQAQILE